LKRRAWANPRVLDWGEKEGWGGGGRGQRVWGRIKSAKGYKYEVERSQRKKGREGIGPTKDLRNEASKVESVRECSKSKNRATEL